MIVETHTESDFLSSVSDVLEDAQLHRNAIFMDVMVSHESEFIDVFTVHLSAHTEAYGYIICNVACGFDMKTSDGHHKGSERAYEVDAAVSAFCEEHNLKCLPGKLKPR